MMHKFSDNNISFEDGHYTFGGEVWDGTDNYISKMRGWYGVGVYNLKNSVNIGTLWRSAMAFGANFIFTIEGRYKVQKSDTCKTYKNIPLIRYPSFETFKDMRPMGSKIIAVDNLKDIRKPRNLVTFVHPESAVYILGGEDCGLSNQIVHNADSYIYLPSKVCLNVSTMGTILLFDRYAKQNSKIAQLP